MEIKFMYMDKELIFSTAQAVTASAASTDLIDQGTASNSVEKEVYLIVTVGAAATAAGAATVNFQLQCDDNVGFASPKILFETGAIAKTALLANTLVFKGKIPTGVERFLRVYYDVQTGPLTAGTFSAYLVQDPQVP